MPNLPAKIYFPAIICHEFASPVDALIALCIPHDEAMNLVVASWLDPDTAIFQAYVDGARPVAAMRTVAGRWAACNIFPELACPTHAAAIRQLAKLLKRGRQGMIGVINASESQPDNV